jgi:acyl-coenzyme A synthetase/AMP-(fatty) acid ligase
VKTGKEVNPFGHLHCNALNNPDGIFLESAATTVLNSEALTYVQKIAFELRRAGILPGSLVALDLPPELGLLFTEALFHEGLVSCVLPRHYGREPSFEIDWVISNNPEAEKVGKNLVLVDGKFLSQVETNPIGIRPRTYSSPQEICRLVFSSGTTGKPKAIALTYEMIEFRAQTARAIWMRDQPFMSLLDASTVSGFFTFYASITDGGTYLVPGTTAQNVKLLNEKSIRSIKASPTQVAELMKQLEETGETLPNLRVAQIAGSVLPPTLARRFRALTGCEIFNVYGSTEVGTVSTRYVDSDDPFDAGLATPGSAIEIVDEFDQPVDDGELGRVRCRRPFMSTSYFQDAEASEASFKDGWFYPGDFGVRRLDGSLALRGRQSEFINAGGVKLDPVQLDLFATALPAVTDACGFGYRDDSGLQQIGLAVVAPPDIDGPALVTELRKAFGSAAPRMIVRVDEVPRNAMGKPLRAVLGERYSASPTS